MQDSDVAREFLLTYLEHDIREKIDGDTWALYDASLIGDGHKQLYMDVDYTANKKKDALTKRTVVWPNKLCYFTL